MNNAAEEIRFVKVQQWRPVYYALLILSAIIAIFIQMSHSPMSFTLQTYTLLRGLTISVIILVAIASTIFQAFHHIALQEYRTAPEIGKSSMKTFHSWLFTGTFLLLIWLGAAIAFIVVVYSECSI